MIFTEWGKFETFQLENIIVHFPHFPSISDFSGALFLLKTLNVVCVG